MNTNYNSSNTTFNCINRSHDETLYNLMRVFFYSVIILVSTAGNSAIIYCVYKTKTMRTFTNVLICNSAVADLLITLVPNVHEVVDILFYKGEWKLGGFMCSFLYMCVYLSVAASTLTLVIVDIDRFCAVVLPYKKYLKVEHLPVVIPIIWLVAFLFTTPTTFIQKVAKVEGKCFCMEKWPTQFNPNESPKHYTVILFVCLYVTPLSLMGFLYAAIAVKLVGKTNTKRLAIRRKYNAATCSEHQKRKSSTKVNIPGIKQKKRVIKMLITVVISFAICWLPVYVIQFFTFFHPYFIRCYQAMPSWAVFLAFFLQYANSAVNPLIYFAFSQSYRKAFRKQFKCMFPGKKKNDDDRVADCLL